MVDRTLLVAVIGLGLGQWLIEHSGGSGCRARVKKVITRAFLVAVVVELRGC